MLAHFYIKRWDCIHSITLTRPIGSIIWRHNFFRACPIFQCCSSFPFRTYWQRIEPLSVLSIRRWYCEMYEVPCHDMTLATRLFGRAHGLRPTFSRCLHVWQKFAVRNSSTHLRYLRISAGGLWGFLLFYVVSKSMNPLWQPFWKYVTIRRHIKLP